MKSLKIKLVRLFFSETVYKLYKGLPRGREVRNPLGLMILAKILKQEGHEVEIIDAELKGLHHVAIANACGDADIVGITCTTPEFVLADTLVDLIKCVNPECKIILGGPHPTAVPKECLEKNKHIDFVVRHEGEITFPDLLRNLDNPRKVKGIAYRDEDKIKLTASRPLVEDLDKYKPDWESVDLKQYLYPFPKEGLVPTANIFGSRGCYYKCRFCYRMFGNRVRLRRPVQVYREMKRIKRQYGIKHFFFYDECFGSNKKWLRSTMELVERLNIKFFCMTRANLVTNETIKIMKSAGLVKMSMGIESGNQDILDLENKGITLAQVERAYKILNKHNIETRGSFIFGHPGEDSRTAWQTIDFARKLPLYRAAFNVMTPYPGTEILKEPGLEILSKNYSKYCRWGESVVRTQELSPADLKRYQRLAIKKFYLQPKVLRYHLKQFLLGERSAYYFRPIKFAVKELF